MMNMNKIRLGLILLATTLFSGCFLFYNDDGDVDYKLMRFINQTADTLYVEIHTSIKDTAITSLLTTTYGYYTAIEIVAPKGTIYPYPDFFYETSWKEFMNRPDFGLLILVYDKFDFKKKYTNDEKRQFLKEHLLDKRLFRAAELDSLNMTVLYPFEKDDL